MITPKLLTNECSAHYPRLWHLVESLAETEHTRPYPIMLHTIAFTQEFEFWIESTTDLIAYALEIEPPTHAASIQYGASPKVFAQLEFFADHIGMYLLLKEDIATIMLFDLADWHNAILKRTAPASLPHYNGRKRCPECNQRSVLQHLSDLFCVNRECEHSWSLGG